MDLIIKALELATAVVMLVAAVIKARLLAREMRRFVRKNRKRK